MKHHPSRAGLTRETKAGPVWTGEVRLNEAWLDQPLRWKRPRGVFVCAHSDLFHEGVPADWICRVFAVMSLAPHHRYYVLTKRPERMRTFLATAVACGQHWLSNLRASSEPWPWPHVWCGVSAEDQPRAAARIPVLLDTPAVVRWVSAEPMIAPLNLTELRIGPAVALDALRGQHTASIERPLEPGEDLSALLSELPTLPPRTASLDWVVVGGESGPGARPCAQGWIKDVVRDCQAARVPVFVKQLGAISTNREGDRCPSITNRKGADMSEWPDELRVREWPAHG